MILESIAFDALALPRSHKIVLLKRFGSAQAVIQASQARRGLVEENDEILALVRRGTDLKAAEKTQKKAERLGAKLIPFGSEEYPKNLVQLHDPPLHLFVKGILPQSKNTLAMIGSRSPTPYGNRIARMIAKDLVREGIVLISGLARGIDSVGHETAAAEKKPTLAVMGTGIDKIYPREHQLLADRILESGGGLVTEFPLDTPPRRENFPQRNRILAAWARGVLVIEAGEKSGTRSTVNYALDLGRDVFAVPGPIDSPLSAFPNQLISQGACLVTSTAAIRGEWGIEEEATSKIEALRMDDLPGRLSQVAAFLDANEPRSVEELRRQGAGEAGEILQALAELELRGWVERHRDGQFILVRPAIEAAATPLH